MTSVDEASLSGKDALQSAQAYYGGVLKGTADLKTSACCSAAPKDAAVRTALERVHPDVTARFYGCGSPIPPLLRVKEATACCQGSSSDRSQHLTVLDLGCGTGRDCFILSQLLGVQGRVVGVDATKAQLDVAQHSLNWHKEQNPHSAPIEFRLGAIEDLVAAGIDDSSIDIVISNCVINLSDDKARIFSELFRVLKPGGELLFSDVFANVRLPPDLLRNPVLHGECLAGAMYWPDMLQLIRQVGGCKAREVESSAIELYDAELVSKLQPGTSFTSKTVRVFKMPAMEKPISEPDANHQYVAALLPQSLSDDGVLFDSKTRFRRGDKALPIDTETAMLLKNTRYARFFEVNLAPRSQVSANGNSTQPSPAPRCCGSKCS